MKTLSIVLPVCDGVGPIERAVHSVTNQTHSEWELLLLGDVSTVDAYQAIQEWLQREPKIRWLKGDKSNSLGEMLNLALQTAKGEFVVYLETGDEFYPEYLANVAKASEKADLVVFGYDFVADQPSPPAPLPMGEGRFDGFAKDVRNIVGTWEPHRMREDFFTMPIAALLGIAHRRELFEKVGGFNELLWEGVEWDFLKRLARLGVEPVFVDAKSGRRCVQSAEANHRYRIAPKQREILESNRKAGKPLFDGSSKQTPIAPVKKIAFLSPHCVVDFTNGAAVATWAGLKTLAAQGFECRVFCGTRLDSWEEGLIAEVLARQGIDYEVQSVRIGPHSARLLFTQMDGVQVTLFENATTRGGWFNDEEVASFLAAGQAFLGQDRPDVVWTYGGDGVSLAVHRLVKRRDIPILFALHNFAYDDAEAFRMVDYVTVPADYSRRYYWNKLGLACQILPNIVNWDAAHVADRTPRYVTFINPQSLKGVYVFARIARELARRRPDIPILVTQGRSAENTLADPQLGILPLIRGWLREDGTTELVNADGLGPNARTITMLPFLPDPQEFYPGVYSVAKLLLMPSLWEESFGLVAAEAMLNGIPVLASNRGALPDTLGKSGFLFDIPARYTPETQIVPSAEEVDPWVETIIRLWDDAAFYEQASHAAQEEAQRWHPSRIAAIYREFFGNLHSQPGPPLMPSAE